MKSYVSKGHNRSLCGARATTNIHSSKLRRTVEVLNQMNPAVLVWDGWGRIGDGIDDFGIEIRANANKMRTGKALVDQGIFIL